jgi:ParB family chromosome partitioning protein
MEQIQDLKTAIELAGGVKQNLTVTPLGNGKYKVLAGHRRRLASLTLVEEGKKEYEFVPCGIEDVEADAELQEIRDELLLIVTNSQRDKTDWDKVEEVKRLRVVLERYKEKAKLPGRVREIIAEALNTSAAQVGRMDAISKNLTEEFQEEMKAQKVGLSVGYELSGLPEEKQKEAFEEYKQKGSLSIKDVKDKKEDMGRTHTIPEKPKQVEQLKKQNKEPKAEQTPKEDKTQKIEKPSNIAERVDSAIKFINELSFVVDMNKDLLCLTIEALEFYKHERG